MSREEAPVDVNSRSGGPRVVFPPLNQNANPPPAASVSPSAPLPPAAANGTMPNNEPRRIRTLAVKGDAADNGGIPAGASAPPRPAPPTRSRRCAGRRVPLPVGAQSGISQCQRQSADVACAAGSRRSEPPTRMAATNPTQTGAG